MWVALFSQTGNELNLITQELKKYPDYVFTTNPDYVGRVYGDAVAMFKPHSEVQDWLMKNLREGDLLTLHGYLYILSAETCALPGLKLNGHPGLITEYPELKGRDPQERTLRNLYKYRYVGCVLHQVTVEVDGGEIVASAYRNVHPSMRYRSILFEELLKLSVGMWVGYLKEVL